MATINGSLGFDLDSAVGAGGADRVALNAALAAVYGSLDAYDQDGLTSVKDGGTPASAIDFYSANGTGSAALGAKLGIGGVNATNIGTPNAGNTSPASIVLGSLYHDAILTGTANGNLTGDSDSEILVGNSGKNIIKGNGGNDFVDGGAGNDTLTTTTGNDTIYGGAGNDTINAGDGNNYVHDESGNDTITTGAGNDTIIDLGGINTIKAGNGDNTITTGAGKDNITGGSGIDSISSGAGDDTVNTGSAGNDYVNAGIGNDKITTGSGNDTIIAGDGRDNVTSGAGNDSIDGGAGNDTISAGDGNDTIIGGYGSDVMTGGAGDDVFVIGNDGVGSDTINDFGFTTDSDGNVASSDRLVIDPSDLSGFYDHSGGDGDFEREDFTLSINTTSSGKGVTINFNDGGSVFLKNVNFDDLHFTENPDGTGAFTLTQGGGNL